MCAFVIYINPSALTFSCHFSTCIWHLSRYYQ